MKPLAFTTLLAAIGCAPLGPRGIAGHLSMALDTPPGILAMPLSVRCQHVRDAQARCERLGLPSDCAWSDEAEGARDAAWGPDLDMWTIWACLARKP